MKTNKKLIETMLISEELLKLYSPISNNLSVNKVLPFIYLAQNYYINPVLGDALMEELQNQIDKDELTDENKSLILKIAPALANYTTFLALRSLTYTVSEKGVVCESSDNSRTINKDELAPFIEDVKRQAEMSIDLLAKYLCKCSELYPLWRPLDANCCNKWKELTGTSNPIDKPLVYFPRKVNKCGGCGCNDNMIGRGVVQRF